MAKTVVTYTHWKTGKPIERVKYYTDRTLPATIETRGRVKQTAFDNRVYYKPSLGKPVIRTKRVRRRSANVVDINKQLESLRDSPEHPSRVCGGLPWDERIRCLKAKMKEAIHPVVGS